MMNGCKIGWSNGLPRKMRQRRGTPIPDFLTGAAQFLGSTPEPVPSYQLQQDFRQRNSVRAFVSVIQTPQAIGTPTAIQARTEVVSSRHAPMPMKPVVASAAS